jgi:hypothetical protein
MTPEQDIALTRMVETLREGVRKSQLSALNADGFCVDGEGNELPEFVFKTSKGLVRWRLPTWEAVLKLSSDLIQSRIQHDKDLNDPMREFEQSIAENKPRKRGRTARPG